MGKPTKAKSDLFIHRGPEPDVKTLAARVREGAERRRAESPPEEAPDSQWLESVLRSQAEVNGAVAGSLRVVAQHLQYAQEQFAAVEQSVRDGEDERERVSERLEEVAAMLEGVNRKVETALEKLAALEQRLERELAG
jgi:chromosome segregation ATPase